jgi:hypothetical protein
VSPSVEITFEESDERVARLKEIFGEVEDGGLKERMQALAVAAMEEYELAFSGSRFPSTMRDLRELRLRLLYEHLPEGEPTDEQVAELFQMTRTQAATLIAGVRARFGHEVEKRIKAEATKALSKATKVNDDTVSIFARDSLARYLSDLIAETHAAPLDKRRDASQTYYLGRTTIEVICSELGVEPKQTVKVITW